MESEDGNKDIGDAAGGCNGVVVCEGSGGSEDTIVHNFSNCIRSPLGCIPFCMSTRDDAFDDGHGKLGGIVKHDFPKFDRSVEGLSPIDCFDCITDSKNIIGNNKWSIFVYFLDCEGVFLMVLSLPEDENVVPL